MSTKVKRVLNKVISDMDKISWLFVKNPGHDFSRSSTLSFKTMMKLMITMGGQSIHRELYSFLGFKTTTPTSSAFVQRRNLIYPIAFKYLFYSFTNSFKATKTLNGYELLAIDGSDIHTPTNKNDIDSYFDNGDNVKGYNLYHINALYDLLDKRYVDVVIQPRKKSDEYDALYTMVDIHRQTEKAILIADRGYESYNALAHIENKGWNYLIRLKNTAGIIKKLSIPDTDEFDIDFKLLLTRQQTKEILSHPEKYRTIMTNMKFDFLPPKSKEFYPLNFRIVRIRLSNGSVETLITNLNRDEFSAESIKKLYKLRWGIETSFRELKYSIGLSDFHSKKADFIFQEIYARLIMYNISMIIACSICVQQSNKKYIYQVNYTEAINICRHFIRNKESPQNTEALISKNILPVRPNRQYPRKLRNPTVVGFIYRIS